MRCMGKSYCKWKKVVFEVALGVQIGCYYLAKGISFSVLYCGQDEGDSEATYNFVP